MSYKTILVHVDDPATAHTRMEVAAMLAQAEQAHLIGVASTGVAQFLHDVVAADATNPTVAPYLAVLRKRADQSLQVFDDIARRHGVSTFERRLDDSDVTGSLAEQARYADLCILGPDPSRITGGHARLAADIALDSGVPVLVVPRAGRFAMPPARVLVGWDGSREAGRAVHHALPLLQRAQNVEVILFNLDSKFANAGIAPAAAIGQMLAGHGIKPEVIQEKTEEPVGGALLQLAERLGAGMLVMGCYGHSRVREMLLGGATRSVLHSLNLPVFMAN